MTTMNALVMRDGEVQLETAPVPGPGEILVKSLACGVCGSDLHITRHADEVFALYKKIGAMSDDEDGDTSIMLGHEYCAEIVSYGPDTRQSLPVGARVTSVPLLMTRQGAGIGVMPGTGGAYSEYFVIDEQLVLPVPDNVPATAAALTEPLAVGLHAVNRSAIQPGDVALVAGCGAIGLAVIAALKARGVETVVASDPQPHKREAAMVMGAGHAVNPAEEDEMALAAELAGEHRVVIYECIGIHQFIGSFIERAPARAVLVITGIHTADIQVNYAFATVKEMDIRFTYYYTPEEFAQCLQAIADGTINWQPMLTGTVGIDGAEAAFKTLLAPNEHIKVVIEPWREGKLGSA